MLLVIRAKFFGDGVRFVIFLFNVGMADTQAANTGELQKTRRETWPKTQQTCANNSELHRMETENTKKV